MIGYRKTRAGPNRQCHYDIPASHGHLSLYLTAVGKRDMKEGERLKKAAKENPGGYAVLVETMGFEPTTSGLQSPRSPS